MAENVASKAHVVWAGREEKGSWLAALPFISQAEYFRPTGGISYDTNQLISLCAPGSFRIVEAEAYSDPPAKLAEGVKRIETVSGAKAVLFAPGYSRNSETVVAFLGRGQKYFILPTSQQGMADAMEKCINGYYDHYAEEEFGIAGSPLEEGPPCETIGVAGAQGRIGTTTLARQVAAYLTDAGKKAACCTPSDRDDTPQYSLEYLVVDYGDVGSRGFVRPDFMKNDIKVIVCGVKESELPHTKKAAESPFFGGCRLAFNFCPEKDRKGIAAEICASTGQDPLFMEWSPDPDAAPESSSPYAELTGVSRERKKKGRAWPFGRRKDG